MPAQIVKVPFGNDEAILYVDFQPEEKEYFNHKEGYGNPYEPAEIEITKFVVGGVDIMDELCNVVIPTFTNGDTKHQYYLDYFLTKHWDEMLKQIYSGDDDV